MAETRPVVDVRSARPAAVALAEATQFELPLFDFHVHLRSGRETSDLGLLQAAGVTAGLPGLNCVNMAGCGIGRHRRHVERLMKEHASRMKGRFVSRYDGADPEAGSRQDADHLAAGLPYREVRLGAGLGHGPFSQARREWLDPVADWARGR